ncbi:MAG: hypothetical protein ACXWB9_11375, partial [Flavisolibacter sp.]
PNEITPTDPVKITSKVSQKKMVESRIKQGKNEPLAEEKQLAHNNDVPEISEAKDPIPGIEPEMKANEPVADKKEKKKLREVVRNIFNPKEKGKTGSVEEEIPRPATGRKSNKRAETNLETPDTEQLRAQIDVSSNDRGNWMMGVSNLKVTVRNRNNLPLQSVIVIVSYFDSNKKLLEKKELNFRNITANGKMTLAAPEHRWADHTELSVGAVEIAEDAYAIDR